MQNLVSLQIGSLYRLIFIMDEAHRLPDTIMLSSKLMNIAG